MNRPVLVALLLGVATTVVFGQTATPVVTDADTGRPVTGVPVTVVYDRSLSEEFEAKREIVGRVKEEFGKNVVFDAGQELPEGLEAALLPGSPMPPEVNVGDVPPELGDLPKLGEGTRWVTAGEHLVEVTPENRIVMIIYDALP